MIQAPTLPRNETGIEAVTGILKQRFGEKLQTGQAIREQHGHLLNDPGCITGLSDRCWHSCDSSVFGDEGLQVQSALSDDSQTLFQFMLIFASCSRCDLLQ